MKRNPPSDVAGQEYETLQLLTCFFFFINFKEREQMHADERQLQVSFFFFLFSFSLGVVFIVIAIFSKLVCVVLSVLSLDV